VIWAASQARSVGQERAPHSAAPPQLESTDAAKTGVEVQGALRVNRRTTCVAVVQAVLISVKPNRVTAQEMPWFDDARRVMVKTRTMNGLVHCEERSEKVLIRNGSAAAPRLVSCALVVLRLQILSQSHECVRPATIM